jgi:radical SAM superfamily enzyme YgiQ (UPF0313 family)
MHVVLVGPELEENLALRYLRGALEAEGHLVTQVDFDAPADLERAARAIAASGARIAGFSMVFTRRADEFARLATRCRELGYRGLTVAGGHFAAFHAERLLADVPALDVIAIGEGERILCDLAKDPEALGRVAGLVWRDGAAIRRSEPAVPEQELDRLPWPAHRRPFDRYNGLPIVSMVSSRGCTHSCGFCSIAAWHKLCGGARHRMRSAADVAAEMGCLWREGVRLFNFHDDNFLGRDPVENLARARALEGELSRQGLGQLAFQIKARPDAVEPELFALLRSMGLFRVFLGIEAGTEASLRALGRGQRLCDNERALEILNGLDLDVAFNLLVLNPDSTLDDFAGNVAFLRAHLGNPMNFCRTEIYEGTPLERRLRKEGRLRGDYWGLDYAIADARAELAFSLFRAAFHERNFGAHPLHYLSGQVDYEHQLRMDFHGTTPELRAATKGFVRSVNANTVGYLEEVIAVVRAGAVPEGYADGLAARVAEDDARLHAAGQALLARVRDLPAGKQAKSKSRAGRATTAVAASLALALAGCPSTRQETAPMEAAPYPPPLVSGAPPNSPADDAGAGAADAGKLVVAGPADAGAAGGALDAGVAKKPTPDAGAKHPPPVRTAPMEAAPPPPPHHTEMAPNWDPKKPPAANQR